ncbi:hypothetical protein G6F22_018065 [Rhizopus arrhizus]|nr:hypothetical protein G6F24_017452 [Rhizopus arrhizus]KAG0765206.1 hypothetical protein G6F22_018065 [Rhizopus arrhizus]
MGGQPLSLPMRVEVIRELGAAVQEIDAVQADGADQPVLGIGQRPALIGAARHVAGDLLAQGVFRDVAPAGVFDHARQREVAGPCGRIIGPQGAQTCGQGVWK